MVKEATSNMKAIKEQAKGAGIQISDSGDAAAPAAAPAEPPPPPEDIVLLREIRDELRAAKTLSE